MKEIQVSIEGMSCGHCAGAVEKAVGALPGVERVAVSLPDRMATVACREATSLADIGVAITEAGYTMVSEGDT